ncbi:MAG TPA: hypothetical protein VFJ21_12935 [Mycobacteriales bacterium]|jgi:hypothetical protein|nr:hypothetical protein [Mycobacteriales bacterium]
MNDTEVSPRARKLAAALEPVAGQVYFAPEAHEEYEKLGFDASSRTAGNVAMPDGPAYFTSRGSILGQVPGEVVAATFGVFNPAAVVPAVTMGWTRTDAATICAARTRAATAQLTRVLGARPDGLSTVADLLSRAVEPLRPEGRPLFAGLRALGLPGDPVGDVWRMADMLREYRGDAHIASWTSAGFDAVEIGLLTELYWGLPMGSYIRSRAWSPDELEAGKQRLRARGLLDGDGFSAAGREAREAVEQATDRQCRPIIEALGDDVDDLVGVLRPWGDAIRAAGGYPASGPHDLAGQRND